MSNQRPNSTVENNRIESLLLEQDSKLQAVVEILQIILVDLNKKTANQKAQEQLIFQALVELNSNAKQANTLHKESQATTQKSLDTTQKSLNTIEEENENLQTSCRQIKQQVKKHNEILEEYFSLKYIALQY